MFFIAEISKVATSKYTELGNELVKSDYQKPVAAESIMDMQNAIETEGTLQFKTATELLKTFAENHDHQNMASKCLPAFELRMRSTIDTFVGRKKYEIENKIKSDLARNQLKKNFNPTTLKLKLKSNFREKANELAKKISPMKPLGLRNLNKSSMKSTLNVKIRRKKLSQKLLENSGAIIIVSSLIRKSLSLSGRILTV